MNCQLDVEILCICTVTAPLSIYEGSNPNTLAQEAQKDFPALAGSVMPV